jgi:RNA polymerase primary sigma factor
MSDDFYDNAVLEHVLEAEGDIDVSDELRREQRKVAHALIDLEDDFFRSGAQLAREELDRAATRHGLSIVETAELMRLADEAELIERSDQAIGRLESPQELYTRSHQSIDLLQTYINDVKRFPLLTGVQEVELARAIEAGVRAAAALGTTSVSGEDASGLKQIVERGRAARDRFIGSNLRLVFAHAKVRRNQGLDFLDLLQEGTIGIIRAVDKFDYRLGYKFSTYATWWVRQNIDRALADKGRVIRLPVHVVDRFRKIKRCERKLSGQMGREPTITEIAHETGFDAADVAFLRDATQEVLSLDAPLAPDSEGFAMLDLIPDERADTEGNALRAVRAEELAEILSRLSYRERRVLELRFGLGETRPMTLDEVGKTFNVTRERIRQIQGQSLKRLYAMAQDAGFAEDLAAAA